MPWADQQTLACAGVRGCAAGAHTYVVAERPAHEEVVPAAGVERRHGYLVVLLLDTDRAPVVVVVGMREPVEKVRRADGKERELAQRREFHPLAHHVDAPHQLVPLLSALGVS